MEILKFCYRQLLARSGQWVKKWFDRNHMLVANECVKGTGIPNFSLIGKNLWRLSRVFTFGGWSVGPVCVHGFL